MSRASWNLAMGEVGVEGDSEHTFETHKGTGT